MSSLFRFKPSQSGGIQGHAFSRPFRVMATLLVGGMTLWFGLLVHRRDLPLDRLGESGSGWFLAGLVMMVWTWWSIQRSWTRIDQDGLHQRWVWNKHLAHQDLAYAKLIRVRGLEWLIAPRLYTRAAGGKLAVFHVGTAPLIDEAERLVQAFQSFYLHGAQPEASADSD